MKHNSCLRRGGYTPFRIIILSIIIFLLATAVPGLAADRVPVVQSIVHNKIENGDSLWLKSDDPLPRAAINSGDGYIEIEFRGLDCKLPGGDRKQFATRINGNLANRLDIRVDGTPPRSYIKLSVASKLNYDYMVFEHSPTELEIRLTIPNMTRATSPAPMFVAPPPEIKSPARRVESTNRITSIKYFRLGDDSDRIVFTFNCIIIDPEIHLLDFPRRIEMELRSMQVDLPVTAKNNSFGTRIDGRLINEMEVHNPRETGQPCIIRFNTGNDSDLTWEIVSIEPGKIAFNIRPKVVKPQREWMIRSLRRDDESKPETHAEIVSLPAMKLEVNWPANQDIILEKINTAASRLSPGVVAELPIELRLYINAPDGGIPYPGLQQ
jgi:hypothetical protein